MNENQYPNQQGYPEQQWQGQQQGYPQQQWQQPPQQQGYPEQQWQQPQQPQQPPKKSAVGPIIAIIVGGVILFSLLCALTIIPQLKKYIEKSREAEEYVLQQELMSEYAINHPEEELDESEDESEEDDSQDGDDTSEIVFGMDYFVANNWVGVNDTALIIPEEDGTFIWYRDGDDKDSDYYSGDFKLYTGDDAVEYLTTESEVKDDVTEDDITELEAPEYGAIRENFVCLVLTNNVEVYYGEKHEYEGDDRMTTTLYGYFVNDSQGYKLTLVKYDNPYEFNLAPEEK